MALALSAASSCAFNPIQAAFTKVAEVSIVGFDARAVRSSFNWRPAISKVVERIAAPVVMGLSSDAAPKLVGDMGFDPLGLGNGDEETLAFYREAEIKHGRIAMLAAVAWPLQEILHPIIVDTLYDTTGITVKDVLVTSEGASPSLLNGGLFQPEILPGLALFFCGAAALEESDLAERKQLGLTWNEYGPIGSGSFGRTPGNFRFDPLNIYKPLSASEKVQQQERELANGRLAMLAVSSYVLTEFVLQEPVVRATPALFEPIFLVPGVRAFFDSAFGMASMDGSIDGVAF